MKDQGRHVRGIIFTTLTILLGLTVMGYLIWHLRPLILPVIIGILLAYLFHPLRTAFKYRWMPSGVRIALLFSMIACLVIGGTKLVQNSLPNDKEKLELLVRLKYKFNQKFEKIMNIDPVTNKGNGFYNLIAKDFNPLRVSLNKSLELSPEQAEQFALEHQKSINPSLDANSEKYFQYFLVNNNRKASIEAALEASLEPERSPTMASPTTTTEEQSILKMLIQVLSMWVLMPIIFVFFLVDDGSISRFFISIIPNRYFELGLTVLEEVDNAIGKYLRGLSMECSLVAISMSFGLTVVGFPLQMALLVGILAGIATSIPLVGPVVGFSLSLTYALIAESIHPWLPFIDMDNLFVAVLIVNVIVMALDNTVYQPIVLGSAVNLHPLVVILGIMAGSMLFGTAGVLLAIPTIVVLKAVIQHTFRGLKDYRII